MITLDPGTWCLTQIEDAFLTALSECTAFQTWVLAANATEAKSRIHIDEVEPPENRIYTSDELEASIPLVIIEPDEDGDTILYEHIADRSPNQYGVGWSLNLQFLGSINRAAETVNHDRRVFKNQIGAIVEELLTRQEVDIESTQPIGHPLVTHYQDAKGAGQFWTWKWSVKNETQSTGS